MTDYKMMAEQVKTLAETDPWWVPMLSNISSLIYNTVPDLNWAGFYLMNNGKLVVGPFQGKLACIHIEVGKGVCGTAVATNKLQKVDNVHEFAGHIACDAASNSEIVVPIHYEGKAVGVLDVDSPTLNRFTDEDASGLQEVVRTIEQVISWTCARA
jgi:L-methionine (R)-S-oxide reductase